MPDIDTPEWGEYLQTRRDELHHATAEAAEAARLPTFEDMRRDAYSVLGDVLDIMRSDWRPGHGPTHDQTEPWHEARRLIAAAKTQINEVARRGNR